MRAIYAVAAAVCLASVSAHAQDEGEADLPAVEDWSYQTMYQQGGLRAATLLDAPALDGSGAEIGEVQDAVFDRRSRMLGVVAEIGGAWGIGDTHVAVPFDRLRFTEEGVRVPVTEDNLDQFRVFGEESFVDPQALQHGPGAPPEHYVPGDVGNGHSERMRSQDPESQEGQARAGQWRASSLLNDYAMFGDGTAYGYVDDLLIDPGGRIQAVVVQTAAEAFRTGHFAFPFVAYGGDSRPGDSTFVVPYAREEIQRVPEFRFDQYTDPLD